MYIFICGSTTIKVWAKKMNLSAADSVKPLFSAELSHLDKTPVSVIESTNTYFSVGFSLMDDDRVVWYPCPKDGFGLGRISDLGADSFTISPLNGGPVSTILKSCGALWSVQLSHLATAPLANCWRCTLLWILSDIEGLVCVCHQTYTDSVWGSPTPSSGIVPPSRSAGFWSTRHVILQFMDTHSGWFNFSHTESFDQQMNLTKRWQSHFILLECSFQEGEWHLNL